VESVVHGLKWNRSCSWYWTPPVQIADICHGVSDMKRVFFFFFCHEVTHLPKHTCCVILWMVCIANLLCLLAFSFKHFPHMFWKSIFLWVFVVFK